jgi:hypothetical protein
MYSQKLSDGLDSPVKLHVHIYDWRRGWGFHVWHAMTPVESHG